MPSSSANTGGSSGDSYEYELPSTVRVSLSSIAKMIDHALLHPTMTDSEITSGLQLCRDYKVATACVKPYSIPEAVEVLRGSGVEVCPVIGFPAGNSTIKTKVFEAGEAAAEGGKEVDMVVNVGKVLSGDWEYVRSEIDQVNTAVVGKGAILKVIFETDYLKSNEAAIVKLCEICSKVGVEYVKTSTGFGFVQDKSTGTYSYQGATLRHLKIMKKHISNGVKIKASGGIRTLDELLRMRALGVHRVGTSSTKAILSEAKNRGITDEETEVTVPPMAVKQTSGSTGAGY